MSFDHPYTCPDIDKKISEAKEVIRDHVNDYMMEDVPILRQLCNTPVEVQQEVSVRTDTLYAALEDIFEGVRSTNQDMRSSAESQISELESLNSELQARIDELEQEQ